jgi:exosome complex RNA-binding protein Rrp42 (RNase PH superfamily)
MLKTGITSPSYEKAFIRDALLTSNIRIDGRGPTDVRPTDISVKRNEISTICEVKLGTTIVTSEVVGQITQPFPDRPDEGFLQFNTDVVGLNDTAGNISFTEISRALERIIRDSRALDTDSLCIVSGEKVWEIRCEVRIVDGSGGNVMDAAILSAMTALKAFRKPEISVLQTEITDSGRSRSTTQIHHSDDREPLPLSLFHTPLSITIGMFKRAAPTTSTVSSTNEVSAGSATTASDRFVFIVDPSAEEESAMDGKISFSLNNHQDLCAMNKPGGVPLSVDAMLLAAQIAKRKILVFHQALNAALNELEGQVLLAREQRKELLRSYLQLQQQQQTLAKHSDKMDADEIDQSMNETFVSSNEQIGIDRDDPILDWQNLHQPVFIREAASTNFSQPPPASAKKGN